MADDTVDIRYSADISDLRQKLDELKIDVRGVKSQIEQPIDTASFQNAVKAMTLELNTAREALAENNKVLAATSVQAAQSALALEQVRAKALLTAQAMRDAGASASMFESFHSRIGLLDDDFNKISASQTRFAEGLRVAEREEQFWKGFSREVGLLGNTFSSASSMAATFGAAARQAAAESAPMWDSFHRRLGIIKDGLSQLAAEQTRFADGMKAAQREEQFWDGFSQRVGLVKNSFSSASSMAATFAADARRAASESAPMWDAFHRRLGLVADGFRRASAEQTALADGMKAAQAEEQFWDSFNRKLGLVGDNLKRINAIDTTSDINRITAATTMFGNEANAQTGKAEHGFHRVKFASAGVTRELIVLSHEIVQGNWSRFGGSLMVMAEMFTGLGVKILGTIAAVGLVGYAFTHFTILAIEAAKAVDKIKLGGEFSGNADLAGESIGRLVRKLDWMRDVATEDARGVVESFARIRHMSEAEIEALSEATANLSLSMEGGMKGASAAISDLLKNNNHSFESLREKFTNLTNSQIMNYLEVQRSKNEYERQAAAIDLVAASLDKMTPALAKSNSSLLATLANTFYYAMAIEGGSTALEVENALIKQNTDSLVQNKTALEAAADAKRKSKMASDEIVGAAIRAGEEENTYRKSIQETQRNIKEIEEGLHELARVDPTEESASSIKRLNEDLTLAQANLARLQEMSKRRLDTPNTIAGVKGIEEARAQIAQIQSDMDKSDAEKLAKATAVWNKLLSEARANSHQLADIQVEAARSLRQFEIAIGNERITEARIQISKLGADEKKSATERLAQITAIWAEVLASDKLTYAQRLDAERSFNDAVGAEIRRNRDMREQIARDNITTSLQLRRYEIQTQRSHTDALFLMDRISMEQKIQTLRDLALAEEQIQLERITAEQSAFEKGSADYQKAENQKLVLHAQTMAELARIDDEYAQNKVRMEQVEIQMNRSKVNTILQAERTLIQDLFTSQNTLLMSLMRMTDAFLMKEIEADLTYVTQRLLIREKGIIAERGLEQGGFLIHLLSERKKTAVTTAGEVERTTATSVGAAARTTARATETAVENVGLLARLGRWIASELGITSAVVASTGTRTATKIASIAAIKGIESAANVSRAFGFANLAAVEAASAVAMIPIVGPVLAPAAAASTLAALTPFVAMASFEVGAWNIPKTMPALLHPGEMVLPRTFAESYRDNLKSGAGGSSGIGGLRVGTAPPVTLNYNPSVYAPERATLPELIERQGRFMRSWVEAQARSGALNIDYRD